MGRPERAPPPPVHRLHIAPPRAAQVLLLLHQGEEGKKKNHGWLCVFGRVVFVDDVFLSERANDDWFGRVAFVDDDLYKYG